MVLDTKIKSRAWSEAELLNYSLKWSLTSYRHYFSFLMFRSIWGFWKWSQMISHTQKHGVRHQNQVSSSITSKVRTLHLEVLLDLHFWSSGQSGNPENSPKWFLIPKNMGIDTKIKSLASPQAKLEIYTLKGSWTSYTCYMPFLVFRSI